MDLAKQSKSSFNFQGVRYLMYLPGLWLTVHLVRLSISEIGLSPTAAGWQGYEADLFLTQEFIKYRNIIYTFYAGVFVFLGVTNYFKGSQAVGNNGKKVVGENSTFSNILPFAAIGLIFTSFSFTLAKIIISLIVMLQKVI